MTQDNANSQSRGLLRVTHNKVYKVFQLNFVNFELCLIGKKFCCKRYDVYVRTGMPFPFETHFGPPCAKKKSEIRWRVGP